MRTMLLCGLLLLPAAGPAAEYVRRPLLSAPVTLADDAALEVQLSTPVSRGGEMAQLDIVFAADGAAGYTFTKDGIISPTGPARLTATLVSDNGAEYGADIVTGVFYDNGVRPRFVKLPPRRVPLRRLLLRGRNVPPISQIYWVEGREKLASGVDEDLAHCEEGKCGWREAMDYCRSRGGRLLTRLELKAMYDDECRGAERPGCGAGYWSSSEYAQFPRKAWYVDFEDGKSVAALKTYTAFVRCLVPAGASYKKKTAGRP